MLTGFQDQPSEGLFTEGCYALIEGDYTDEDTFVVIAIGHPPCENRDTARSVYHILHEFFLTLSRSIYGHIDFLGKGATTLVEDVCLSIYYWRPCLWIPKSQFTLRIEQELPDLNFFFLSDVWLDHPETFNGLRKMFDNCVEANFIPKVIVLCGNFTTRGISHGSARDLQRYQGNMFTIIDAETLLTTS